MLGDDLNVTRWVFAEFPLDIESLPSAASERLLSLCNELQTEMEHAVSFKLNAGKRVGTYNLANCRSVTDRADKILCEVMGLIPVSDDLELLYSQMVLTDFDESDGDD